MTVRKNMIANRYEVISHIGQGGMADVFLAVDTILNRQVAVKILRSDLSTDTTSILRFEREAQAAASLAHPNIVEIYDVGDYKGHHFIVMEYVPGKTLKQVIRSRGPLVNEEAVDIMKQLCAAVSEAHSRGIIHRDIKPQNVIVKADGSVKILDFGIATAKGSMQLTQANNVMGSVHYLAPELAKGEQASPQSDIYSLGIVFYEMLAGDVPFKSDQAVQIALKHMRDPMPSVRMVNQSVPQSIENIITRATAKNPRFRYHSCEEMLTDTATCLLPERMQERKLVLPEEKRETVPEEHAEEKKRGGEHREKKDDSRKPRKRRKTSKLHKVIITMLGVIVTAGIVAALLYTFLPRSVAMPGIAGMSVEEASEVLKKSGLEIDDKNIEYELTNSIEKGQIIESIPSANENIEEGTKIHIKVSAGIGTKMDSYIGQNITTVQKILKERYPNLSIEVEEKQSDEPGGTILSQTGLNSGDLFDPNAVNRIVLTYSAYQSITIPPEIIGMDTASATRLLESLGVEVRTSNRDTTSMSQEEIDALQYGVVVECDPNAGSDYTQRQSNYITLYYY